MEIAKGRGINGVPELAKELGYKSPEKLYRLEREENAKPSYDIIVDLTNKFEDIDIKWLLTGKSSTTKSSVYNGPGKEKLNEFHTDYYYKPGLTTNVEEPSKYLEGKKIRVLTAVVNQENKEVMSYVTVKAQAGYAKGYGDPHFLERLPAFSLPGIKEGSYRMFEVDGDSMLQIGGGGLHSGDIVIAQYVEDVFSIRDNRVYVILYHDGDDRVVVKRCVNRLREENPVLLLNSDNKNGQHKQKILRPHQIVEVWELKAFISKQLTFATDLWTLIGDLQTQQELMKEEIREIKANKLLKP